MSVRPTISPQARQRDEAAVDKAEKKVNEVLEDLEDDTGGDVKDIDLEDMVDTDPATGGPVIKKAVDIDLQRQPAPRRWSR